MEKPMQSAIYEGRVLHARRLQPQHGFSKRLCMLYLDLAELDRVFEGRWLWGVERARLVSFRRRDHLGDPDVPHDTAVRALVRQRTGRRLEGPIRLLTQLRTAGYVFKPVSLYYGFDLEDELDTVVADVSNTPWNERHAYVLRRDTRAPAGGALRAHLEGGSDVVWSSAMGSMARICGIARACKPASTRRWSARISLCQRHSEWRARTSSITPSVCSARSGCPAS